MMGGPALPHGSLPTWIAGNLMSAHRESVRGDNRGWPRFSPIFTNGLPKGYKEHYQEQWDSRYSEVWGLKNP
jgi:hypothetical protein